MYTCTHHIFYHMVATDKSPQLLEFVNLIKGSAETSELFESIQNDVTSPAPTSSAERMELS